MRVTRLIGVMLAVAAVGYGTAALAAAPAWDISGAWTSYSGNLDLRQAANGSLTGTFTMKIGCTDTYSVGGKVDGSAVSIALTRAGGGIDSGACAGSQSLKGTVAASGTTMQLALVNAYQTSPAFPFTGKAKKAGATATTTAAKTTTPTAKPTATATLTAGVTRPFSVFVVCDAPHKQLCPTLYTVGVKTPAGRLRARFITSSGHCSDVRLRLSVDGGAANHLGVHRPCRGDPLVRVPGRRRYPHPLPPGGGQAGRLQHHRLPEAVGGPARPAARTLTPVAVTA